MTEFVVKSPILHGVGKEKKRYGVGELIELDLETAEKLWNAKAIGFPTLEDLQKKLAPAPEASAKAEPVEDSPFMKAIKAHALALSGETAAPKDVPPEGSTPFPEDPAKSQAAAADAPNASKKPAPATPEVPKNVAPDDLAKDQTPDAADAPDASKKPGK